VFAVEAVVIFKIFFMEGTVIVSERDGFDAEHCCLFRWYGRLLQWGADKKCL